MQPGPEHLEGIFFRPRAMAGAIALDAAFAFGTLSAWSDAWITGPEVMYDRLFEGARHALIEVDSAVCGRDRALIRPLLDLLTGVKVGSDEPVATAVLQPGMHGFFSFKEWGRANPNDLEVLSLALPRLQAMSRPLGPVALAVVRLTELSRSSRSSRLGWVLPASACALRTA